MATNMKRFTISLTEELEAALDKAKREMFYNRTQSEMIRELLSEGVKSLQNNPTPPTNKAG